MIFFNIHERGGRKVIAICDEELVGMELSHGKIRIDLKRYSGFYTDGAKKINGDEDLKEILDSASSINAIGEKALSFLKKNGYDISGAKKVGEIPYIMIFRI